MSQGPQPLAVSKHQTPRKPPQRYATDPATEAVNPPDLAASVIPVVPNIGSGNVDTTLVHIPNRQQLQQPVLPLPTTYDEGIDPPYRQPYMYKDAPELLAELRREASVLTNLRSTIAESLRRLESEEQVLENQLDVAPLMLRSMAPETASHDADPRTRQAATAVLEGLFRGQ